VVQRSNSPFNITFATSGAKITLETKINYLFRE
jgi:hypothetical protein